MNERLQAIYTALQYIEDHLQESVTVADLAAAAGYSLYHFIRTFNQMAQYTPYDYLMRRRLSEAARELLRSERRVIEIALDLQFNNHETFTRAFRRVFGMPPSHWREQNFADSRLLMPALSQDDLIFLSTPTFETPKLITRDDMILAGLMTSVGATLDDISTLWQNLRAALRGWSENPGQALSQGPRDFWGIRAQLQISGGGSFYFAGVKILSLESVPSPFVIKIIPAGDYVCLAQKTPAADMDAALRYLYHTFLPKAGYQLADPLEIEHFGTRREILIPVQGSQPRSQSAL